MRVSPNMLADVAHYLADPPQWMRWNLMLALIPCALAAVVFRHDRPLRGARLVLAVVCLLFLPNAAYVLTDVIHLPNHVRAEQSDAVVLLGVVPLFGSFMTVGFAAHIAVVRCCSGWARRTGVVARRWRIETPLHAATAVGIYLGRVHRFNSWDLLDRPSDIAVATARGFTRPAAVAGMMIVFGVLLIGQQVVVLVLQGVGRELREMQRA